MIWVSIRVAVVEAIGELTGFSGSKISDAQKLADDLGIDSMVAVSLLVAIEERVGMTLPDGCEGSLVAAHTVGELVESLSSAFGVGEAQSSRATALNLVR